MVEVAASLLSANSACFKDEVERAIQSGVDRIHLDVMDHHFVPNLTFGPKICRDIRKEFPLLTIDVHMMTFHVESLMKEFIAAGASSITFHSTATPDVERLLTTLQKHQIKAGLAINPNQQLEDAIEPWLSKLDMILVMSVMPGFAGQTWVPSSTGVLQQCTKYLPNYPKLILAVDGGINHNTAQRVRNSGAKILVSGSYLFSAPSMKDAVDQLKG
ncbi:MAG TPA: ribulose-phosphate 3-epimerase [Gammaproteobacteria bacterium]|nr:ribulose-phosphate 3-epimerase [Gammaproteobacteria bacterium]